MPLVTKRNVQQSTSIDRELSVREPKAGTTAYNEADSNADTCCLGKNFIVLSFTNRTADVYPYDESYQPMTNVPIVSGATVVDLEDGSSFILILNESLYYGTKLDHSLINPNQLRHESISGIIHTTLIMNYPSKSTGDHSFPSNMKVQSYDFNHVHQHHTNLIHYPMLS
jgi:hypothetical protein